MHLRRFDIDLVERQEGNCPAGTTFFNCVSPSPGQGFKGCCIGSWSCSTPSCPDSGSPPATVTVSPLPSTFTSISTVVTPTATQTIFNAGSFASATSSPTPSAQPSSKSPAVPIIAGAVSGVVAISILSVLLWFCCKRRRQKKDVRESIVKYGMSTREYVLSSANTPEATIPKDGDVFGEFGGRHKSPSPASMRPAPVPAPLPSQATSNSMNIGSPIDAPIPDIEKSGLTPPPMTEHPAYHIGGNSSLPESPQTPSYRPGQQMHSPPMEQHPAYHVSQLNQHPAFSPRSSLRSATFPQRTTEVKRQKSSPRSGGFSGPMDITPIIPVLPTGRSELEAEVPDSYTSPITRSPPRQEIRVNTTYNPADYANYDSRTRNHTVASTYSIPIGLGVLNSPLSPSQYRNSQQGSLGVVTPLSPHQQQLYQQYQTRQNKSMSVISPTQSIISPQSPFHLETQYSHLSHPSQPAKPRPLSFSELREGKEKEAVVSPVSPERWSGSTCLNTSEEAVEMHELGQNGKGQGEGEIKFKQVKEGNTPVNETPTGLTPSDDFKTWETWAQR